MNLVDTGAIWPLVISQQGTPDKLHHVLTTPTGTAQTASYAVAFALAEAYLERQKNRDILPSSDIHYEWTGILYNVADDGTTDVTAGYPEDEADAVGVYARDAEGLAVWLTDVPDSVQAEIVIGYLRNLA